MSNAVVNLQDNRAVFRIFIALINFPFDSPSYKVVQKLMFWQQCQEPKVQVQAELTV